MEYAHVAFAQESRQGSQVDSVAFQPRFHVRVLTISDAMPTTLAPDALCGSQFGGHCADAGQRSQDGRVVGVVPSGSDRFACVAAPGAAEKPAAADKNAS
jgi:hypothetical protein